ncbi:50S ribosomal protein L5 [Bienertia sinuspersici]
MGDDARGRGKNKRLWSSQEENALVEILLEMQNSNRKYDTGYKTSYQSHIEKKMLEKFPYCGLKGKPHIESKIKILKRQLGYILEIQEQAVSGFGWDDELKMITGEKETFMGWAHAVSEIQAKDCASGKYGKGSRRWCLGDKNKIGRMMMARLTPQLKPARHSAIRRDRKEEGTLRMKNWWIVESPCVTH